MNNLMKAVLAIAIITIPMMAIAQEAPQMDMHIQACYMPNGTQEQHIFEYDIHPGYDLCTEVGGVAY